MDKEIEKLFKNNKGLLDTEAPEKGHRERFLDRLESQQGVTAIRRKRNQWFRPLSIAASVAVLFAVGIGVYMGSPMSLEDQVAKISPEAANTEYYFASLIEEQVNELQKESSPETQKLIGDTMNQLQKLIFGTHNCCLKTRFFKAMSIEKVPAFFVFQNSCQCCVHRIPV